VKKAIAILCFSVYLFGATDAHQLLRLPLLVQHYVQHKKANSQLSIIDFLKIHYSSKVVVDADYKQDMQLPFKTHEQDNCQTWGKKLPPLFTLQLASTLNTNRNHTLISVSFSSLLSVYSIFQPPRIANV
jgi:hypothetical protein